MKSIDGGVLNELEKWSYVSGHSIHILERKAQQCKALHAGLRTAHFVLQRRARGLDLAVLGIERVLNDVVGDLEQHSDGHNTLQGTR